MSKKILIATYTVEEVFNIPTHINLEDKSQVKDYHIYNHTLFIELVDKRYKPIKISSIHPHWKQNMVMKIEDASDEDSDE